MEAKCPSRTKQTHNGLHVQHFTKKICAHFYYMYVCLCVKVTFVGASAETRRGCQVSRSWVTGGGEPPDMGAVNQTQLLWKSRKLS